MDALLKRFKKCFEAIPENDARAKIGPREFVLSLLFCLSSDRGKRTLESIRRSIKSQTGKDLSRGSFWERLATRRLFTHLLHLAGEAINQVSESVFCCGQMEELLSMLKVNGILVLDSTSMSLPKLAGAIFPGPRRNVAPAVIKWHSCFDLFGGIVKWFDLSCGTSHDQNHFPDLSMVAGHLIIFDLGYFDYCLLQAIDNVKGFFLSRIKTNSLVRIHKVVSGLPKSWNGKMLFSKNLPKGRDVIEVLGSFKEGLFEFRVIGFWNPVDKSYHWYVTNLAVPAKLIYPIYRLRWQCELLFKMAKSSLRLADISSADPNIIQSLVLSSVVLTALSQPLAFKLAMLHQKDDEQVRLPSLQRAGSVTVQVSHEFMRFLLSKTDRALATLKRKLKLFANELFDPNRNRETSMLRVLRTAGIQP